MLFKIIKFEMIDHKHYYSIPQAKTEIFQFIEVWYNRERIYSVLGYKTPVEFMEMYYQEMAKPFISKNVTNLTFIMFPMLFLI